MGSAAGLALLVEGRLLTEETEAPAGRRAAPSDAVVRELFAAHWTGLCRLAGLILGDHAWAEEVVQEAFLRTCDGWGRLRQPDRADLYLRATVVNLCRSRLRRRSIEWRVNSTSFRRSPEVVEPPSTEPDEAQRVAAAVRALPPRQRSAVVLRYYEDLSEAEIAVALGCSVGTVKSQLAKARQSLGRRLADEAPQESRR